MKYFTVALLLFLQWTISAQPIDTIAHRSLESLIAQIRTVVQHEFDTNNYPGLAVAVSQDGQLIWSEGFGYANVKDSVKVDPAISLFRIGSVSKVLTAAGLAKLVERDDFDLDAPIQQYVPDFPEKKWLFTTRQVAQHIAGIRHYRGLEFLSNTHYNSVQEALEVFMHDTLLFMPGQQYSYSSYGWNLISAAIEGATHKDFLEYMHEEVFKPAGMLSTYPDNIHATDLPRVTFYNSMSDSESLAPPVDNSVKWASGGFLSTAIDLVRFGTAIINHKLVQKEITEEFWTPAILPDGTSTRYGMGWTLREDKDGRPWVGHSGGSVGGSSMFMLYPEEKLIVVVLINRSNANAQNLALIIADQFLN